MNQASDEVLHGSRKFTFDAGGKTYAVDLNRGDLGLSPGELKELSLNGKYLGDLKKELSHAWDNAMFDFKDKFANRIQANWTQFMYGTPMAYSKSSKFPELDLWKSISVKAKRDRNSGGSTSRSKRCSRRSTRFMTFKIKSRSGERLLRRTTRSSGRIAPGVLHRAFKVRVDLQRVRRQEDLGRDV